MKRRKEIIKITLSKALHALAKDLKFRTVTCLEEETMNSTGIVVLQSQIEFRLSVHKNADNTLCVAAVSIIEKVGPWSIFRGVLNRANILQNGLFEHNSEKVEVFLESENAQLRSKTISAKVGAFSSMQKRLNFAPKRRVCWRQPRRLWFH